MKKIAIISLYGDFNYGNKLQNYAVQQFYRGFGLETELIKTPYAYTKDIGNIFRRALVAVYNYKKHLDNFKSGKIENNDTELLKRRKKNFRAFSGKFIVENQHIVDKYNAKKMLAEYDYCSVGSDQVWNPMYVGADPLFYLDFTEPSKRLSIAASIGLHSASETRYAGNMGKLMKKMRLITVREESAQKIVKDISGRDSHVILDPTLLIDESEWSRVEARPECEIPKKYIYTYLLGDTPESRKESIRKFAKERGCEVVSMNDSSFAEYYSLDPSHFLYLIKNAEYVITDSYHCTVFSLLYKKSFCVLKKLGAENYMMDRLYTLLSTFGMTDRISDENSVPTDCPEYSEFDKKLSMERERAKQIFEAIFKEDNII